MTTKITDENISDILQFTECYKGLVDNPPEYSDEEKNKMLQDALDAINKKNKDKPVFNWK